VTRALSAAIVLVLAPPLVAQERPEPAPAFEVASIKAVTGTLILGKGGRPVAPGSGGVLTPQGTRWQARNVTLRTLIRVAYGQRNVDGEPVRALDEGRLVGGPSWIGRAVFDVEARMPEGPRAPGDTALMLRSLLIERFALKVHEETREIQVYALVPVATAPIPAAHVRPASMTCVERAARVGRDQVRCGIRGGPERITGDSVSMGGLAAALSSRVGRVVVDRTGLAGSFDFLLRFASEPWAEATQPSILQALREQLGLELESTRAAVTVLVIDRVEPPTPN
jgi:uncharacterized protein (TIGR03435 family)